MSYQEMSRSRLQAYAAQAMQECRRTVRQVRSGRHWSRWEIRNI